MCLICVEFQAQRMTRKEALKALAEYTNTTKEEDLDHLHIAEVIELVDGDQD